MKITEITIENPLDGKAQTYVIEELGSDTYASYTKERWEELQAQKEASLGGTL